MLDSPQASMTQPLRQAARTPTSKDCFGELTDTCIDTWVDTYIPIVPGRGCNAWPNLDKAVGVRFALESWIGGWGVGGNGSHLVWSFESLGFTLFRLVFPELPWVSLGLTWNHLASFELAWSTWCHWVPLVIIYFHLVSLGLAGFHLDTPGLTWCTRADLGSVGFPWAR